MNPLRIGDTALAPPVLLMAKLIALAILLTNHVRILPDPFLPFLPFLEGVLQGPVFQKTLQAMLLLGVAGILFNRWVRVSCFLAGMAILTGVLASRAYYGNNKTFCAIMLVLASLSSRRSGLAVLRFQLALVYFGAGLNKALDPDWHSGQFFDHWAGERLRQPVYLWLNGMLPPLALGKLFSWTSIVLELSASVALMVPRLRLYGVAISMFLQSGFLLFTGSTFTLFFYGMQAALFVFLPWPAQPMPVIYDGDCGFCDWCRRQLTRLDRDKVFQWWPFQSGRGEEHGISVERARERLQLVTTGGKVLEGFHAVRLMLIYTPVVWFVFYAMVAFAPGDAWRRVVVGMALFLISPLANAPGMAAYDWVARHRHRIFGPASCEIPPSKIT